MRVISIFTQFAFETRKARVCSEAHVYGELCLNTFCATAIAINK